MRIEDELKQERFADAFTRAVLNVLATADWLSSEANAVLKPFDLSKEQYNVLRILKGRHPAPCTLQWIGERMISKASNATRLVEKLRQKGRVERTLCPTNRRKVDIRITQAGLDLLDEIMPLLAAHNDRIRRISDEDAHQLNHLLDTMRG
jgi:DNA-binding MarR family transcriptional regulator